MEREEKIVASIILFLLIVVPISLYNVDKSSCYDKAKNYQTDVTSYSFIKDYCFVNMEEKVVNLENYRDTNSID